MPDASLPPLPPAGQPRWRTAVDDLLARLPTRGAARSGPAQGMPATGQLAGALVLVLVLVLLLVVVARRPPAAPATAALPLATPAPAEPPGPPGPAAPSGRREPEEVVVDVAGAVARPGLVRLRIGARVADAVAAAGGPTPDAAPDGLNQARVLADGEQVRVPRVGEPPPTAPPAAPPAGTASPPGPATPLDLNRATPAELDALPGVGPATATAIIAWRDEHGGFRRVDDLLEVPGIGPARLERLRPHVRV